MAVIEGGVSGSLAEVGVGASVPQHVTLKPIPHGSLGHYRTNIKLVMATTQAANSKLFEVRNTGSNLLVLTRCAISAAPAGTVTTAYLGEIGLYRATGFSVSSTTGTVTPTTSVKRTSGMAAYPGGAAVRHATIAGVAAGMTGFTMTLDANQLASCMFVAGTFAATTGTPVRHELVDDTNGTHPLVAAQNEGWVINNVVVGSGTANVVHVVIDVSWTEVTLY